MLEHADVCGLKGFLNRKSGRSAIVIPRPVAGYCVKCRRHGREIRAYVYMTRRAALLCARTWVSGD